MTEARSRASRELLAPRADVWAFLAEPYHLSDWFPGVRGVEPDRRGFAVGARWRVSSADRSFSFGLPRRLDSGPTVPGTLEIQAIVALELWAWQLVRQGRRPSTYLAEVRLEAPAADRTVVTIGVSGHVRDAQLAVDRLYELVQTAAAL